MKGGRGRKRRLAFSIFFRHFSLALGTENVLDVGRLEKRERGMEVGEVVHDLVGS